MKEVGETHPFEIFIPNNATVLIIGSFPSREHTQKKSDDAWYYGAKRNQFWSIISQVYKIDLPTIEAKKKLFTQHGIGIADILRVARRRENNNLDTNLEIIEYNDKALREVFLKHEFKSIFFTSKFVEKLFLKIFPEAKNTECLPSPSPRFARMSKHEKVNHYQMKLPK